MIPLRSGDEMELNYYESQKYSMGTNRENIVPRNLCTMRANVRHRQKRSSFPLEKLPIQSILSSRSKNSEHPWWSRFASGFS